MINFKAVPFLRILFPFVMGIACVFMFGMLPNIHIVCLALFILFVATFLFQRYYKPAFYLKKGLYVFSMNVFLFSLAFESSFLYDARNDLDHYTRFVGQENQQFIGTVDDLPVGSEKTIKLSLGLNSISYKGQWHYTTGSIIVYFKNGSIRPVLGDKVFIDSRLSYVNEPANPGEFNYKAFLEDRNIFNTAYVKEDCLTIIPVAGDSFSFSRWGTRIKSKVVAILRESGLSKEAFSICTALLVGYDEEIDREVMQSFSHSGTLHILSVSGMHTGVLYGTLLFLFSLFDKYDRYKKLECFFVISSLLLFVGITGFSPSVLRAVLMLSLVILGKTFYKQGNSYNTLLLSAFLLLLYNPNLIKDVGFLLSYLAVFGIMYFYPVLSKLYIFQNKMLQWLWASVLISVSATLFTMPVSLYYFHQFPTWFVLSNMVIIPASMFLMLGAILILVFAKMLLAKQFFVYLVNEVTSFMLWCAKITDEPGYGFIDFISFSKFDMLCCFLMFISFLLILARRQYKHVCAFCVIALVWLTESVYMRYNDLQKNELVVFHVKNKSVFALRKGQRVYADFSKLSDNEFQRCVKPYLLQISGMRLVPTSANLFKYNTRTIANLKDAESYVSATSPDIIVVSNNAEPALTINHKTNRIVIADCSNSYRFVKKLRKQCSHLGITFYSIEDRGALKLSM